MKREWWTSGVFRSIFHTAALTPLLWIVLHYFQAGADINPVQTATQRSGDTALVFLLLSLACRPLSVYMGWRFALSLRRSLGLYAFFYGLAHVLFFLWADYGWQFDFILPEIAQKRYLWAGCAAFAILLLLALISNRRAVALLGRGWRALQRLVYPAAVLVVLHVAWVVKGDLLRFSGDIWKPLAAGLLLVILLLLRLPVFRTGPPDEAISMRTPDRYGAASPDRYGEMES